MILHECPKCNERLCVCDYVPDTILELKNQYMVDPIFYHFVNQIVSFAKSNFATTSQGKTFVERAMKLSFFILDEPFPGRGDK